MTIKEEYFDGASAEADALALVTAYLSGEKEPGGEIMARLMHCPACAEAAVSELVFACGQFAKDFAEMVTVFRERSGKPRMEPLEGWSDYLLYRARVRLLD